MTAKPNLFIIGAMKSGTTSLHSYLDQHPKIAMSEIKEPGYFVEELSLHRGESWYLSLFDFNGDHRYRGESSTHYTKLPRYKGVAERMHRFNPGSKLIYIMRDPFERLVSHYWHAVRDAQGGGEFRSIARAIAKSPDYQSFSNYALQLRPFVDRFGKDSIHTLTFEAMVRNPQSEVNAIFDWLEIAQHPLGTAAAVSHNQKPDEIQGVSGVGALNRVQYSAAWDYVSPHVPAALKRIAKRLAYRSVDESAASGEILELKSMLRQSQRREIDALSRLLDREFPEWEDRPRQSRLIGTSLAESP